MRSLRHFAFLIGLLGAAGCRIGPAPISGQAPAGAGAARQFVAVANTVEPAAERACRARAAMRDCDFLIVVDDRPGQPPNAFQTLDKNGRPLLIFTVSLLDTVDNVDELAFIMGHEAAHHILGHLGRQADNATVGSVILSGVAVLSGASDVVVREAGRLGAEIGARRYSKEFELEADALGTVITADAGYDPVRGAVFFTRIPDPGDRFLGTHPPNAERMDIVRRTAARLGAQN